MNEIEKSDKGMRVMAIIGGIVGIVESMLQFAGAGLMPYNFGIWGAVFALIFAILAIVMGIRPIHYAPFVLALLGILLIIFASLIGGIIVLLATFIGFLS
jgi:hypothetical protein